jgi:hypothetical protein
LFAKKTGKISKKSENPPFYRFFNTFFIKSESRQLYAGGQRCSADSLIWFISFVIPAKRLHIFYFCTLIFDFLLIVTALVAAKAVL